MNIEYRTIEFRISNSVREEPASQCHGNKDFPCHSELSP